MCLLILLGTDGAHADLWRRWGDAPGPSVRESVSSATMKITEACREVTAERVHVVVPVDVRRAGPEAGAVLLHGLLPGLGRDRFGEPVPQPGNSGLV